VLGAHRPRAAQRKRKGLPPWEFRHKPKAETKPPDADTRKADEPQAQEQKKEDAGKDVTVYITKTGKKYHADGCRYLSKSMIPISLKEAKDRGYTPCPVCAPPQ
jgi:hypothetical protein